MSEPGVRETRGLPAGNAGVSRVAKSSVQTARARSVHRLQCSGITMNASKNALLCAVALVASACGSSNDADGPPSAFQPLDPDGGQGIAGSGGESGARASLPPEPGPCGTYGAPCCEYDSCESDLVCENAICGDAAGAPPDEPPPPPPSGGACGGNGDACCATGSSCSGAGGKAKCCTACSGAPDFNCVCDDAFQPGGTCQVCCVVCKDGFKKTGPLAIGQKSCQEAAGDWCQENRKAPADAKAGWRNDCEW